jgi:hypothetical protein
MRNKFYLLVLSVFIILLYAGGCKDSPTANYYNTYIVDSLNNPNVNPRVIFTNPADGSTGPYGSTDPTHWPPFPQITIQFNKLINYGNYGGNPVTLKTEDADYPLYSIFGYDDIFSSYLIFELEQRYWAAKTYTLTIDTTFIDVHGKKLSEPFTAVFVPEPKFRVYYVSPTEYNLDPSDVLQIYLLFNSKIDETIFNSLSISPEISGNWTMYDTYYNDSVQVFFNTTEDPACNTEYTVSLAANAKDHNGLPIDKSYQFSFKTDPFRVELSGYSSYIGPGGFYISNHFEFRFNAAVDTSTVRNSISVSPQISYNIWFPNGANSRYVRLDFNEEEFQNNTEYTIHFASTIKSAKGEALEEYNYKFSTGP